MEKGRGDKAVWRDTAAKMSLIVDIKELKQLGRRRQRRLQKTIGLINDQNNSSARVSRFSVHFFDVYCTTTTWNFLICRFMEHTTRNFFLSLKERKFIFLATFSLPSSSYLLKVPILSQFVPKIVTSTAIETRSSQSIKIGIDLSIDKSIKIGKSDLIDIDCIDQSVEIDDTLVSFIDLSWFLPIPSIYIGRYICSSVNPKMKTDFMQAVNLLTTELQLIVEGSNNYQFLKKSF